MSTTNNVSNNNTTANVDNYTNSTKAAQTKDTTVSEDTFKNENEDTAAVYEKGGRSEVSSNVLNKIDDTVKNTNARTAERMSNMVAKVLGQQIQNTNSPTDTIADILSGGTESTEGTSETTNDTSNDYYGVEQTSGRILDFAKALGGDDPEKISILRQAVDDGFNAAAQEMGFDSIDDMPQITKDTYAAVMSGFDEMQKANVE